MTLARRRTPLVCRPAARYVYRAGKSMLVRLLPSLQYEKRRDQETGFFGAPERAHELPPIFQYWVNRFLAPMLEPLGFTNALECFRSRLAVVCRRHATEKCRFLSIGGGGCEAEINIAQWLHESGIRNFVFDCIDITAASMERAEESARRHGFQDHFEFTVCDINRWSPQRQYHSVLALQSLHHIVRLEAVFDRIHRHLLDDGYFMADDMIGRNGHQRWPEALSIVQEFWEELPERYKYNHQLLRLDAHYTNFDCSNEGFEGIRAQDILQLLIQRFHFETFAAFGNVIDVFIDRGFGPNFDPTSEWDTGFIDRVHARDMSSLESGLIKPTHMIAVMQKQPPAQTVQFKHLSPQFCLRLASRS